MEVFADISAGLASPRDDERRRAVESIERRTGDDVLTLLITALRDSSWRVRKSAVQGFLLYPDRIEAAKRLVEVLAEEESVALKNAAAEALSQMGGDALPPLTDAMNSPDKRLRKFAVDILGAIGDIRGRR